MTRDDIIRMAGEAASEDGSIDRNDGKNVVLYAAKTSRFLERFAALVAAAEREACAKMVEDWDSDSADPRDIATAIGARGKHDQR